MAKIEESATTACMDTRHARRSVSRLTRAAIALGAAAWLPSVAAQDGASFVRADRLEEAPRVPHVAADYRIDGVLDDEIWSRALVFDLLIETNPGENEPAPVSTYGYVVENGSTLLVAFDARDPRPELIRAYLRDRDAAYNDDFVGIVVDTFGDERRAFEFFSNPLGVQMDLIQDDVNRREDDSWDAIWESAGRITDNGYSVEMAIPFSQLRFPRSGREQTWSIDLLRIYPRENRSLLSISPRERGRNCYLCQLPKVRGFAGAEPGKDLEVVPSVTASRVDTRDTATAPLVNGDTDGELGVTVSWGITPDLTANIALNPDFSQVEADVAQLDVNNQFSLFFPETRPFFLEGAETFDTPIQAVFTRTVADPDYGAKLTGRSDEHAYGIFAAEDAVTNLLFPGPQSSATDFLDRSNQVFVGRYTHGVGTNASTVGALFTSRSGDDYANRVGGVDGRIRVGDRHRIDFQYLLSETEYPDEVATNHAQPEDRFDGYAFRTRYEFDSRNWWANVNYRNFDPGFRADTGFVTQVGYEQLSFGGGHVWQGGNDHLWNQLRLGVNAGRTEDSSGNLLQRSVQPFFGFSGPLQSYVETGFNVREQLWNGRLYDATGFFLFSQLRPIGGLNVTTIVDAGEQIDFANSRLGEQLRIQPSVDWNINRHLLARVQHTYLALDTKDGESILNAQLSDVRLTWQFNLRSFLRLTAQWQDVERNDALFLDEVDSRSRSMAAQLLYSYKVNPQTVFFLGYSDNYVDGAGYESLTRTERALFLKLSYAWVP